MPSPIGIDSGLHTAGIQNFDGLLAAAPTTEEKRVIKLHAGNIAPCSLFPIVRQRGIPKQFVKASLHRKRIVWRVLLACSIRGAAPPNSARHRAVADLVVCPDSEPHIEIFADSNTFPKRSHTVKDLPPDGNTGRRNQSFGRVVIWHHAFPRASRNPMHRRELLGAVSVQHPETRSVGSGSGKAW